jgi:putative toxin-antitoxin system antitoxin component (TIGR02293 family)
MVQTTQKLYQKLDKEITSLVNKNYPTKKNNISYSEFLSNKMMIIVTIKNGIPSSLFNAIQDLTQFTETDWASFLNISTKSLHRYKQNATIFKPIQSEKIIEIAEVTEQGLEVFGDINTFKHWLNTANYALGNLKPIELLNDSYGKEMVLGELTRINYGILV